MNILLPTDFSENSKNAAAYALQYFEGVPCTFHLLHVSPFSSEKAGNGQDCISQEIQKNFLKFLLQIEAVKKDVFHTFQMIHKADYFVEALRALITEKNIDLILMGTKGISNSDGILIGKNTSDVMTKVKCPALAISENAIYKTHHQILFPTDYKIKYSAKMLKALFFLSNLSKASIKILELFNSEKEPSEEQILNKIILNDAFPSEIPTVQTFYASKNLDYSSLFTSNVNVDMIVMAAKNLNLCQRLLKNNSTNHIPFIKQLPMLVLHG